MTRRELFGCLVATICVPWRRLTLDDVLSHAKSGETVWIAEGVYIKTTPVTVTSTSRTFYVSPTGSGIDGTADTPWMTLAKSRIWNNRVYGNHGGIR